MEVDEIQKLLTERSGTPTYVYLADGEMLYVNDLYWLYDEDDEFAYAITNSEIATPNVVSNTFYTNEVVKVVDYKTLMTIYDSGQT